MGKNADTDMADDVDLDTTVANTIPGDDANTTADEQEAVSASLTGIESLCAQYGVSLRLWTAKAPREVTGTISAVFLQDESPPRVVLLAEQANGKFSVWERV